MAVTIEVMREVFGWCSVVNIGLLLWWFVFFTLANDWVYRLHARWFTLSREQFHLMHYAGMVFFKLCILFFNLIPYVALHVVANGNL